MQKTVTSDVETAFKSLRADPAVAKMLADIEADATRTLAEQRTLAEIPSPPFKERRRAEYFLRRVRELGLADAAIDREGNVVALRTGSGNGPRLVVASHLDSVFAEGTDVRVKEADGTLHGPGIGDNARGLAVILSLLRAMAANGIETVGDIMWVGSVGEEELGNLRGVRALLRD